MTPRGSCSATGAARAGGVRTAADDERADVGPADAASAANNVTPSSPRSFASRTAWTSRMSMNQPDRRRSRSRIARPVSARTTGQATPTSTIPPISQSADAVPRTRPTRR